VVVVEEVEVDVEVDVDVDDEVDDEETVEDELELVELVELDELVEVEVVVVVQTLLYGPRGATGSHLVVPLLYCSTSPSATPESSTSSKPPIFKSVLFKRIKSLFIFG